MGEVKRLSQNSTISLRASSIFLKQKEATNVASSLVLIKIFIVVL